MTDSVLNILKVALLALLYLFFARVLWAVWSEVRGPRPGNAPVQASAKSAARPSTKKGVGNAANRGVDPRANAAAGAAAAAVAAASLAASTHAPTTATPATMPPPPPPASARGNLDPTSAAPRPPQVPAKVAAKGKPKAGRKGQVGRLIVLEPRVRKGTAIGLAHEITFGRAPGCTVSVPDDSYVSQVHARVYRNGDAVIVEDVGSTNGTYVNGNRITAAVVLRPGDRIQFGTTVLEAN